ncbi:MAG: transporter, partial [Microvirga sp.]|nr:transporter [Microvirga sp.]
MTSAPGRLSFLYAALFLEIGVNLPFFPLWLDAQSLKSDAIGIILARPARHADRRKPDRGSL